MDRASSACRPAALEAFRRALTRIDTTRGLVDCAVAISAHELPDADAAAVWSAIEEHAAAVRRRVPSGHSNALLAHTHQLLFEEEGFSGNARDYYDPHNSYLPSVLATRRGIPITLVLLYKTVLEQLGVAVQGIAAPGHFLARVEVEGRPAFVDPFWQGALLTRDEALGRIEQVLGRPVPRDDSALPVCTHPVWLRRMIGNLKGIFQERKRTADLHAMLELELLLGG